MVQEFICKTINDLPSIAQSLINTYPNARVFALYGDMGAGKTTFVKSVAETLKIDGIVTSPTFSIVNSYTGNDLIMYHFDFYRIKDIREAYDIGYEEYFYSGNYCFIEWPELIESILPDDVVSIKIDANDLTGNRIFTF